MWKWCLWYSTSPFTPTCFIAYIITNQEAWCPSQEAPVDQTYIDIPFKVGRDSTTIDLSMAEVKLLATWFSRYRYRVIWALKMKGIQYKYIEDDLFNKSTLLLQHNPVHKKVPVLIHGGKPIVESMVILEYIEETWPHCPLLSKDPFERTLARFWSKFADDMGPVCWRLYQCSGNGEEREKAVKECLEMLEVIEDYGIGEKFFGGDAVNIVDLAFGGLAYWFGVIEEIMGIKLLESHKFPRLNAWIENFKEVPVIKENHPDRERMLEFYKTMRERLVATP